MYNFFSVNENLIFRYKAGIIKLKKSNKQINQLKVELTQLKPELVFTSLETRFK